MNFRFGVIVLFALATILAGCGGGAATAGGGGEDVLMPEEYEDEIPEWVNELPPGEEPEGNNYSGQAELALVQAYEASESEDEAEATARYEEAIEIAQEGLAEFPNNAELYRQAGTAMLAIGRYEEGAAMMDRAEEIYPRIIWDTMYPREVAWVDLLNEGFDRQEAGDLQGAIESFELANTVYSYRPEAMINLGAAYAQIGNNERAIEMYRQAVEVIEGPWGERADEETRIEWEEHLVMARSNLAQMLLIEEQYDEAADVFALVVDEDPDDLQALSSYGAALVGANRMEEAEAIFDELLNRPGLDAADFYSIAVGLYQAENFEQAALAFQESYERVPDHRDVVYNLAQTYFVDQRWDALEPIAEQLIEVDPLNQNAYTFLAQAYVNTDRDQEGMAILDEREALPYYMEGLGLQVAGEEIVVAGQLVNRSEAAGTPVTLRIFFYDVEGMEMGTQDTTVELGPEGEAVAFQVAAPDDESLFGFRYEELP